METADSAILEACRNKATREKGFRLLVEKYQERLYYQILRTAQNHEDTDDILQNVFIKVWRYLDSFQEQSKLYTWLYRIAVNETLNFLKQKNRRNTAPIEEVDFQLSGGSHGGEETSAEAIEAKLKAAIEQLPDKQKIVFNLRYYEEMGYEEMSEVLETSVGALKASYHHAVKKIEAFLTQ